MSNYNDLMSIMSKCFFMPVYLFFLWLLVFIVAIIGFSDRNEIKGKPKISLFSFWMFFIGHKPIQILSVIILNSFVVCGSLFYSITFASIVAGIESAALYSVYDLMTDAALYVCLAMLISICNWMSRTILSRLSPWYVQVIRSYYFDYIIDYGYGYNNTKAISISRIIDIVDNSQNFLESMIRTILPTSIFAIVGSIWLFRVDTYFGLLYLSWIVIQCMVCYYRMIYNSYNMTNALLYKKLQSEISDSFNKIGAIKINRTEEFEKSYYRMWNNFDIGSFRAKEDYNANTDFILNIFYYTFFNGILIYQGIKNVILKHFTMSKFIEINGIARYLSYYIWNATSEISKLAQYVSRTRVAMMDLNEINEVPDSGNKVFVRSAIGTTIIRFKDVCFGYAHDRGSKILNKVNLEIKLGERYALVGHSGSGKSTLIHLLMRFFDPKKGEILANSDDGMVNLKEISLDSVRQSIGIVPQSDYLFSRPIFMNIGYGCKEIMAEIRKLINTKKCQLRFADLSDETKERIIAAAKAVRLDSIINKYPKGYDSIYGEDCGFSGGQKQRLSIARAMVKKNISILILDEATSALDAQSEAEIVSIIKALPKSLTIIQIAHKLQMIKNGYQILVMKNGVIAETGSHNDLIAQKGVYYNLYSK